MPQNTLKTLRIYLGLAYVMAQMLFDYALAAVWLVIVLAWYWIVGHKPCPGPTGWAPGSQSACEWCNPRRD